MLKSEPTLYMRELPGSEKLPPSLGCRSTNNDFSSIGTKEKSTLRFNMVRNACRSIISSLDIILLHPSKDNEVREWKITPMIALKKDRRRCCCFAENWISFHGPPVGSFQRQLEATCKIKHYFKHFVPKFSFLYTILNVFET